MYLLIIISMKTLLYINMCRGQIGFITSKDLYKDNTYYLNEDIMIKFTRAYITYEKDKTPTYVELEGYAFIK